MDQGRLLEECARLSEDDDLIGPGVRIFAFYLQIALSIIVALLPGSDFSGSAWTLVFTFWALLVPAAIQLNRGNLTLLQAIITCRLMLLHSLGSSVSLVARYSSHAIAAADQRKAAIAAAASAATAGSALSPIPTPSPSGNSFISHKTSYLYPPPQAGANGHTGHGGSATNLLQPLASGQHFPTMQVTASPPTQRNASLPLKILVFASNLATLGFSFHVYLQSASVGNSETCNNIAKDVFLGFKTMTATKEGTKAGLALHITLASIYLLFRAARLLTWLRRKLKGRLSQYGFHIWEFGSWLKGDRPVDIHVFAQDRRVDFYWSRELVIGVSAYLWIFLIVEVERTLDVNRISDTWISFGQFLSIATPLVPAKTIGEWLVNWWHRQNNPLPIGTPALSTSEKFKLATTKMAKCLFNIILWPVALILHVTNLSK